MYLELFSGFEIDIRFVLLGLVAVILALLVLCIVLLVKTGSLKKKYELFMKGKNAESLEETILKRLDEVDCLKVNEKDHESKISNLIENMQITYQKIGINKYDAFNEMGGKLSFALALLDKNNTGFVINAMHSREGCYTYIKEIIRGESFIILGEEEKKAIDQAIGKDV